MHKLKNLILILLPGMLFLFFWQYMVQGNMQREFFFSAPTIIVKTFISEIPTSNIWVDILYTGFATITGVVIGTLAGSALGVGLWVSPRLSFISKPYLTILGAIPVFSIAPMMIIWFGIGLWSKIVMASFAVFLVATAQAYDGALQIAKNHLLFAQSLGAKPRTIVRYIIMPGAINWVIAGIRMNIGFALVMTFIAEYISSEHGLGYYILKAGGLYDMPRVFIGIFLIAMLSISMQFLAARIFKR